MVKFQNFIEYFEQYPLLIQLVWVLSGVFAIIILMLIVYLKLLRSHLRKNEIITEKFQKEYESHLITYLYSGNVGEVISAEQQLIINKLKLYSINKFKRTIIVSILLKLKNEISGEMAESIQKLYFETDLIKHTLVKLKSKKWYIIASGIRELTRFQVKEAHDEIIKYINHPKREIRKEVQLYLVDLFNFEGLTFLNGLKATLSEWDQIQLLEELQKFKDQDIPDIVPWLKSENKSVVLFALKLARMYNQFEVKDTLIDLLSHKSKEVRIQLISTLSHLQVLESKTILKSNFSKYSLEEQLAFFKMLENVYEVNDEAFLLEHIHNKHFEIKLSALKILKIINIDTFKNIEKESTNPEYANIVKFVENN